MNHSTEAADQQLEAPAAPSEDSKPSPARLRLWPAALLLLLMWTARLAAPRIEEPTMLIMMGAFMVPAAGGLLILVWSVFFSRAPRRTRWSSGAALLVIAVVTTVLQHRSILGFGTLLNSIPWGFTGFAAGILLSYGMSPATRWRIGLVAALAAFGFWDLVRSEGITGGLSESRYWRWTATSEAQFLARLEDRVQAAPESIQPLAPEAPPVWPEFRGVGRRAAVPNVALLDDWKSHPPRELWRIAVGPGWSSFSAAGDRLFTQEQRGSQAATVCFDAETGAEIWADVFESRFWEPAAGAGPRATPTISGGRLFALGAQGLLRCLDPESGKLLWQADLQKDASREPPTWGFSASPLVVDDSLVVVHAGGEDDKGVLAYDFESGALRWSGPSGDHTYSSPQLAEMAGERCVLMLSNKELRAFSVPDGRVLWEHVWDFPGYRVVQPLVLDESSVLMGTSLGHGTRRLRIERQGGSFQVTETWTAAGMKPYFNDYVAHRGALYGFDHKMFACLDLATGERRWRGGRYGNGQVLLLPDADQLLVLSETGELILLRADAEALTELARFQALHDKTWNHPVLIGDRLYVRNDREAACFQLSLKPE